MIKKSITIKLTLLFSTALLLAAGSVAGQNATPQQVQKRDPPTGACSNSTDSRIVDEVIKIDDKIELEIVAALHKAYPKLSERKARLGFSPTSDCGVVRVFGGVPGNDDFFKVIKVIQGISSAELIKSIDLRQFQNKIPKSCDENTQKECNGICIDKKDRCNVIN